MKCFGDGTNHHHLLCPLLGAALEILSDASPVQKGGEGKGCLERRWGLENANGPNEKLAWEVLHKAAGPWYGDKEMVKTLRGVF